MSGANTSLHEAPIISQVSNSLAQLTATEFLRLFKTGEISAFEYATACADEIQRHEPEVHAWEWYDRNYFLQQAREADLRWSSFADEKSSPATAAYGVPVGVKDIFNTADMPTAHGSQIFAGYMPGNDARVVTSMRRAGSIIAGKTVTAEFAVHAPGKTRNPIDLRRSCGTSSSGSAAAVASCMVPIALGSQTAGSIIRPASYVGVFGFKPSFGVLPRTAVLKTTDTLDTIGLMARSVSDLSLMFEIMRVRGANYPIVDRELSNPKRRQKEPGPWRVGLVEGPKSTLESAAVKAGMRGIVDRLVSDGCKVETFLLPPAFDKAHDVHETVYRRALAYYFKHEWARERDSFSATLACMIEGGLAISPMEYHAAIAEQTRLAREMNALLGSFDIILAPSTADEAPIGLDAPDVPDHNLIWTMCHMPSLGMPLLRGTSGLPVGLQIGSQRFNDYIVMDFADYLVNLMRGM